MSGAVGGEEAQSARATLRLVGLVLGLALALAAFCASPVAAAPQAPTLSAVGSSGVTFSAATLNGVVNPRGGETNYYFQYGKTSGYGSQTPLAPLGSGTVPLHVAQQLTGLEALTTYHFRLVATGPAGTAASADHTFSTPRIPLSLQIAGVPNPVPFGEPLVLEGTLSGTGAANHAIVLQANPFPYTRGFQVVGNPELTNASGAFSFPVLGVSENTQLRVVTVGKPEVASAILLENVAIRVTFHARRTHHRGRWRLYGTVTPAEAGALVGFQRVVPGGSTVNAGGAVVRALNATTSSFSRVVRLRHRGVYRALVKINDGAHVSAYSAPVLVR